MLKNTQQKPENSKKKAILLFCFLVQIVMMIAIPKQSHAVTAYFTFNDFACFAARNPGKTPGHVTIIRSTDGNWQNGNNIGCGWADISGNVTNLAINCGSTGGYFFIVFNNNDYAQATGVTTSPCDFFTSTVYIGASGSFNVTASCVMPDVTAPIIQSAATNTTGTQITLTYNEDISTSYPWAEDFTVKVNTVVRTVSTVSYSGSDCILTVSPAITSGQSVTVSYDNAYDQIIDNSSNKAASLTNYAVTNNATGSNPTSTIAFDTQGGSIISPITQDEGTTVTPPANPTRSGYTFAGWIPAVPATMPVEDLTCVAQWNPIPNPTSTITFDVDGGTPVIDPVTQDEGTAVTPPANPTRSGYTFAGWIPAVPATMPVDDLTCVAQWEIIESPKSLEVSMIAGRYNTTTKVFTPLAQGETLAQNEIITVRVSPITNFKAGASSFVIMFDKTIFTIMGSNKAAFIVNSHTQYIDYENIEVLPGYTGNHWYDFASDGYTGSTTIADASWPASFAAGESYDVYKAISVSFTASSNSLNGGYVEIMPGTWLFQFRLRANQNIIFGTNARIWMDSRWFQSSTNTGVLGSVPVCSPTGFWQEASTNHAFSFDFTEANIVLATGGGSQTSTISFDSNGGSAINPITQNEGTSVTPPADPTRSGYTFAGWIPAVPATMPVDDVTCVAQWNPIPNPTSTITFDVDGGTPAINPITQDEGTPVTEPANPTKAGYTFQGWVPAVPATMPTDDVTCVAQWTATSSCGVLWTARTAAEAKSWSSVTYGNGLFVAVAWDETGATNTVMTSPDGINWTIRSAANQHWWNSVTYGNGLFVAVAVTGSVMTSPDGITWTPRSAPEPNQWFSVTYGNGLFVAVANDGPHRVMTSPDGITWTARTAAEANKWYSVTYGNGLFVAVSESGTNRVMTSPDGITWSPRSAAEANYWYSVTYGNGLFVAVAQSGTNRVMTSPDGITWTARTVAASTWYSVTYGNSLFVSVAISGTNRVMTSPDGITWTVRTAAEANGWTSVTSGNGLFVGVAFNGTNRVMTSECTTPNPLSTITFNTDGGNAISPITQNEGSAVTPPADPTKAGYTFQGWIPAVPATMPVEDLTCVAQWELSCMNPTNGGTIEAAQTICHNTTPAALSSSALPDGHTGTLEYKWQSSTTSSSEGFTDISPAATGTTYAPGSLTTTTWFKRLSKVTCDPTWSITGESNVVKITITPASVGGSVTGGSTICTGNSSGTLTLGAYTGTIVKWQWSIDPFSVWNDTLVTTPTFISKPLSVTTQFRAVVQSGSGCTIEYSTPTTVTVIATVAGSVSGSSPVCYGSNSGELTLTGHTGSVVRWQSSVSPYSSWTNITNTSTTYTSGNLTESTRFRAVVKNQTCTTLSSASQLITVSPVSIGGSIASVPEICSGTKPASLVLSGQTGSVIRWEKSTDVLFTTPITIASTATTLTGTTIGNLTESTYFRAVVKSGACPETNSDYVLVTVNTPTVAGTVTGPLTWVCSGSNSGLLTLSGETGTVMKWQSAVLVASVWTWSDIAHTGSTYTSGPLTESTRFRAVVQNGVCALAYSTFKSISVRPNPTFSGGSVSTPNCSGADVEFTANGLLPNINNTFNYEVTIGSIVINGTKNAISDALGTATYSESGIGEGIYSFKLNTIVVAGCSTAISDPAVAFTVSPQFSSGEIRTSGETICYNGNPGEIGSESAASGGQGTITYKWESSTDDFITPGTEIPGAILSTYDPPSGLTVTTSYRRYAHDEECNTAFEASAGTWKVTVYDQLTLSCPEDISVNAVAGTCSASVAFESTTTGIPTPTLVYKINNDVISSPYIFPVGTTTVTTTASNVCETLACSFTVTVTDTQLPTITCPATYTASADQGKCYATITNLGTPQTGDNCGLPNVSNNAPANNQYPLGNTTVTWTVVDVNNNFATCKQTVTVTDNQLPVLVCPADAETCTDVNNSPVIFNNIAPVQAYDLCSAVTINYQITGATTANGINDASGTLFNVGTSQVKYIVKDASNNISTCSFLISVYPLPVVTFTGDYSAVPLCTQPFQLTGGQAVGGTYTSQYVVGNTFYPRLSGPGTHPLTYTFINEHGCSNSTAFSVTIQPPLEQTVTVGNAGDFTSLTGSGGLFAYLNASPVSANITAMVLSDLSEPGTHALNALTSPGDCWDYSLLIVPGTPGLKTISGNTAQAMIRLNGADKVTINGNTPNGKGFLLRNSNTTGPVLLLDNAACNNKMEACIVEGSNSSLTSGLIVLGNGSAAVGNSTNTFTNNLLRSLPGAGTMTANLFYSSASSGMPNSNNKLTNNEMINFSSSAIQVTSTGNGGNWQINNNDMYFSCSPVSLANQNFIMFKPGSLSMNNQIKDNSIGGTLPGRGGAAYQNNGSGEMKCIDIHAGNCLVSGNQIGNISLNHTHAMNFSGITIGCNGTSEVLFNTISAITIAGTGSFTGISSSATGICNIRGNSVFELTYTASIGSPVIKAIELGRGVADANHIHTILTTKTGITPTIYGLSNMGVSLPVPNLIINNMIAINPVASGKPKVYGIFDNSITGEGGNFYHNTVYLSGPATLAYFTAAFYRIGNGNIKVYNNILVNKRVTNSMAKHYAIVNNSIYSWQSDYNDLITGNSCFGKWGATEYNAFMNWKAMTGQDLHSLNLLPQFVSATDLHLSLTNSAIDNKGTPLFSTGFDYDGSPRSLTTPDMGAHEFTAVSPRESAAPVVNKPSAGASLLAYPNPFTSSTLLEINLSFKTRVELRVYTLLGEEVQTLVSGELEQGMHSFRFGSSELPAGIYICQLRTDDGQLITKRIEMIR